ncbi:tricarboxylic transport TctC [Paenibacillus sp. J31TS4]|uniref:Bug family tripartite tricarboxylate transporter substrate binding protein n=1 Tax=Paenibacillus sp. J31TS4 TaxID=2807195 RepID=UPI001B1CC709|nr:tripartite tricarboxylate transporter substrate binding protein [Paenibacillus sp. J31TS4]GIP40227.1 tricarboxylic transport TctC [Paenibacillus sp. J31TS4]
MKARAKWAAVPLAVLMAVSLTACGTSKSTQGSESDSNKASAYPQKPITVVAPSGAGGGWDKTARSLTKVLAETKLVNSTMTVENKPGGGGTVYMAEFATKEKKNPYTLMVSSPPILINNLKKEGSSPYGYKDTTPLAQLTKDYGAIAVKADSKYSDLKTLLADLKADPSKITMAGGSAPGSMDHLVAILPAFKAGIDPKKVKYVSYDGGGEAVAALLGNNATAIGTDASSLESYLKSGKVKVLAVTSSERLKGTFKDVPTLKELGLDAEFNIWRGVFGPKEMSKDELAYWEKTLKALTEKEEWKKELAANTWESDYKNSADFTKFLGEQEKLVKDLLTALNMAK